MPDEILKDAPGKRGNFLFIKKIERRTYLVMVEIEMAETGSKSKHNIHVVSASFSGEKYLKKFTLLWREGTANSLS